MGNRWSVPRSRCAFGALLVLLTFATGCPTVDLGDTPTDIGLCNPPGGIEYFEAEIWPNFVRPNDATNGCTRAGGCHNEAGGNGLSFQTNPVDVAFNYRQAQQFLNCGTPAASQLLTKPLDTSDPHLGGNLVTTNDAAYTVFIGWFE